MEGEVFPDFENFKINVMGRNIELPLEIRAKYYDLCLSQKLYLHRHLIGRTSLPRLFITEMVNIANEIRESKISTTEEEFADWYVDLNALKIFGLNIGFMKARVEILSGIASAWRICKEAVTKLDHVEKQIDVDYEVMYEKEASAPW